jgi:hypothetical protein
MALKSSVSSMFYALPLLVSLAQGHEDNKHSHHGADASAAVPVSQYLNSFSIEFKNLPDFAGMSIPLASHWIPSLTLIHRNCIHSQPIFNQSPFQFCKHNWSYANDKNWRLITVS